MTYDEAITSAQQKANTTGHTHYVAIWWSEEEQAETFSVHDADPGRAYPLDEAPTQVVTCEPYL